MRYYLPKMFNVNLIMMEDQIHQNVGADTVN